MRFSIEIQLENKTMQKDKNRMFISLLKKASQTYSEDFYNSIYSKEATRKNFTFSVYLGLCTFTENEIVLEQDKIYFNFSTYDYLEGIMFYNSFLNLKNNKEKCRFGINNSVIITKVIKKNEHVILNQLNVFKTISPIAIRERKNDENSTYYHSLQTEEGVKFLNDSTKTILVQKFPELYKDILDFEITIEGKPKLVKVKNYNIVIDSNLAVIKLKGNKILAEYIYKAGLGSKTNSGFGMLEKF